MMLTCHLRYLLFTSVMCFLCVFVLFSFFPHWLTIDYQYCICISFPQLKYPPPPRPQKKIIIIDIIIVNSSVRLTLGDLLRLQINCAVLCTLYYYDFMCKCICMHGHVCEYREWDREEECINQIQLTWRINFIFFSRVIPGSQRQNYQNINHSYLCTYSKFNLILAYSLGYGLISGLHHPLFLLICLISQFTMLAAESWTRDLLMSL